MEMMNIPLVDRLPAWLRWFVLLDVSGRPERDQRRQLALNVICVWGIASCFVHGVFYVLHDPSLWPASLFSGILACVVFMLPFVKRLGPVPLAMFMALPLTWLFVVFTYLLGIKSGSHFFILIIPPVLVVILGSRRWKAIVLATAICAANLLSCLLFLSEPALPAAKLPPFHTMTQTLAAFVPIVMITATVYLAFLRAETAEDALEAEHARSEALLYNLLPEEIAAKLKVEPDDIIADSLPQVAILFADIVDFTPRSARMAPEEIVSFLNRIFSAFDTLAEKHGLEKIKTIGDAYMVAAGMPNACEDPVHRVAEMALDMLEVTSEMPDGVEIRIGLHAGPAVAGVIGNRKLFYDVWGDTVNTASRMESHGEPGRVQVTLAAKEALGEDYSFTPRGTVVIKGMGDVETFWLIGKNRSN